MLTIKFKNWDKHQPRKDLRHPWYFNFQNNFFLDTKMYALEAEEKLCLIYLLCEASRANKMGELLVIIEHYRAHSRLPERVLNRTIEKLIELQVLDQPRVRGLYASCTPSDLYTRLEVDKNRIIHVDSSPPNSTSVLFDFDSLYKEFPRKEGKTPGMKICKRDIKTQEDFQLLGKAIKNYKEKKAGIESRYLLLFSTFMNQWRDWSEHDTGTAIKLVKPEPEWVKKIREEEKKNGVR